MCVCVSLLLPSPIRFVQRCRKWKINILTISNRTKKNDAKRVETSRRLKKIYLPHTQTKNEPTKNRTKENNNSNDQFYKNVNRKKRAIKLQQRQQQYRREEKNWLPNKTNMFIISFVCKSESEWRRRDRKGMFACREGKKYE